MPEQTQPFALLSKSVSGLSTNSGVTIVTAPEIGRVKSGSHSSHMTADRLREARKALGWTQKALADQAGTHYQAVKYWERQAGTIGGYAVDRFKVALMAAGYVFALSPMETGLNVGKPRHLRPLMLPQLCGAKNRKGNACRCLAIAGKARCKFHGGLSTGPKSAEGKERIAQAQRLRWRCHGLSPIAESLVRAMVANGKLPERRTV